MHKKKSLIVRKIYIIVLLIGILTASMAQGPAVTFNCVDANGNPLRLDSVHIDNLTRSWSVTLHYPNLSVSLGDIHTGITELEFDEEGLAQNIPNPFDGHTCAQLTLATSEHILMRVYDMTGRVVAYYEGRLESGKHDFNIVLSTPQIYILQVTSSNHNYSIKMVNMGKGGEDKISLISSEEGKVVLKSAKQITDYGFEAGDLMSYQGFVTINNDMVTTESITQNQYESELITFILRNTPPIVTTNLVSNITDISASCGGNIISMGGSSITARGVCWSTSPNPTINDSHTEDGGSTGSFTSNINGLNPFTTYYVRAYASNSHGTGYGSELSFTTTYSGTTQDGQSCPGAPAVDIDGNVYNTVMIGTQCWMKENLRTTRYSDSTSIPLGSTTSNTGSYRYFPNNNSSNVSTYGYLYNWPAVMHGTTSSSTNPSGVQGICPNGWHVPSDAEWTQLTNYVSSQSQYVCGGDSAYIAKALASTMEWNYSTGTCAVGNDQTSNNATGFLAFPAGSYYGEYDDFGDCTVFWSATEHLGNYAYRRHLFYNYADVNMNSNGKFNGFSVRCVRNAIQLLPTVTTSLVSNVTETSATCGGDITYVVGGASVTACGVSWSTSHNPTINDSHTTDGSGTGSFTSNITGLNPGTLYYVRAYATNSFGTAYGNELCFWTTAESCPGMASVIDIDNNMYNTVQIGNQCWMRENLRTTRYANGMSIALGSGISTTTAYRYYPNNDSLNVSTYGYLYNWPAVMHETTSSSTNPSGVQGICPNGWHVPSVAEWTLLTDFLSNQCQYVCGGNNTYLAKALASTTGWDSCIYTCAVGNNPSSNNATGFSALPIPAGYYVAGYDYIDGGAKFWSATAYDDYYNANIRIIASEYAHVGTIVGYRAYGYSVRCVYDGSGTSAIQLPAVTTSPLSNVTATSVICGGDISPNSGLTVTARGVSWGTSHNPTICDSHTIDGSGTGSFTSSITGLIPGNLYYVRAYAYTSGGTAYGNEFSIITTQGEYPETAVVLPQAVTDIDGNSYDAVQIGNQIWMAENLRTTRYSNGTSIPMGSTISFTAPYRYYPNDVSSNVSTHGYLYNWKAVMGDSSSSSANPSGVQGICPIGWHVPSDAEWTQLYNYMSSQSLYMCGSNNTYIAKALASITGWNSATSTCAVGNNPSSNNATGFSALPAGYYRDYYSNFGSTAHFWSASEESFGNAYCRYLICNNATAFRYYDQKSSGFLVRCVRD